MLDNVPRDLAESYADWCCVRLGEIAEMDWSEVDFEKRLAARRWLAILFFLVQARPVLPSVLP
jgi:hypothetical protein